MREYRVVYRYIDPAGQEVVASMGATAEIGEAEEALFFAQSAGHDARIEEREVGEWKPRPDSSSSA